MCVQTVGTVHNSVNHLYCEEVLEQQPVLYVNNNDNVNNFIYNYVNIKRDYSNSFVVCVQTVGTVHNSVNHLYCEEVVEQQTVLYVNNDHNVNYVNNKQLIHRLISNSSCCVYVCTHYT